MIDKILNFFKADYFVNDTYGWATNQISHIAVSFVLCYLFGLFLPVLIFWLGWEIYQLIQTKNFKDFFEDLGFEIAGICIFLFGKIALIIALFYLVVLLIFRLKNND